VFLEDVPNADFDLVECARRLDDEVTVESVPLGGDVEGVVEVGFILRKIVVVNADCVAVRGPVWFSWLHGTETM
jgi:hypothetical protein